MDKLKMHSPDLSQQNIARIRDLVPGCVTEAMGEDGKLRLAVDFDQLRQELSGSIVEGPQERYQLNWPGKRAALLAANAHIAKTFRPCRDESVDFDSTRNLFIEGDNLDALSVIGNSLLNSVDVIYIDPPYNTGRDFVYKDDRKTTDAQYRLHSGQLDESGFIMQVNSESNGRFHSDWLSMIYARLKLSRNVLKDHGLIFISIDNNELASLKILCDEIFGSIQFIGIFKWNKTSKAPTLSSHIREKYEYVICYVKGKIEHLRGPASYNTAAPLFNSGNSCQRRTFRPGTLHLDFPDDIYKMGEYGLSEKVVTLHSDLSVKDGKNFNTVDISGRFKWSQETLDARIDEGTRVFFKTKKFGTLYYSLDNSGGKFIAPSDLINQEECNVLRNDEGHEELASLFAGSTVFDYCKPTSLISHLIEMSDNKDAVVLDFFAGSGTCAQSVIQLNSGDGGRRKFILIQAPEVCNQESTASKFGFNTISDLCKERIRRAGKKILEGECHESWNRDIGFRVLKIDSSNMAAVHYTPDHTGQQQASLFTSHIKPDRTPEDILFQVLLDWGVDITLPIATETIAGKQVFIVDANALIACFDQGINEALITALAKRQPLRAVFRDDGFTDDSTKINAEQIFKQLSPTTDVKVI